MLRSYLKHVTSLDMVARVLLICKEPLVGLYEGAGFVNKGPSGVVHGQDPWLLCAYGDP